MSSSALPTIGRILHFQRYALGERDGEPLPGIVVRADEVTREVHAVVFDVSGPVGVSSAVQAQTETVLWKGYSGVIWMWPPRGP